MADAGRKDFSDKAAEKVTPDSQKSLFDKAQEGVTDAGDKVAGAVQPSDDKSVSQKLSDSTSTNPGEESYLDTAKKTVEDAVEYVEKTATGKAAVAAQRTERYANRNPRRLESQIADLVALKESQGGKLSARDQKQLEEAEKDVARVKKAREALGDKAPAFNTGRGRDDAGRGRGDGGRGRGGYGGLGKRPREEEEGSGEETDESVRKIPWPRDTPPPIPRQQRHDRPTHSTNANSEPLGADRGLPSRGDGVEQEQRPDKKLPPKPAVKTTYESAPQVRDLKKEATARFVPSAVRKKIDATRGKGGTLLEEDEVERLEREGYGAGAGKSDAGGGGGVVKGVVVDAAPEVAMEDEAVRRLREEEERFAREMEMVENLVDQDRPRGVRMEEVSDEDL